MAFESDTGSREPGSMSTFTTTEVSFDAEVVDRATMDNSSPRRSRRGRDEDGSSTQEQTSQDRKSSAALRAQMNFTLSTEAYTTPIDVIAAARGDSLGAAVVSVATRKDKVAAKKKADAYMKKRRVVHPDSPFRRRWDLIQVILLAYVAISVPYRIGFEHDVETWGGWFFFDAAVDLYFIVDVYYSFKTAFIDEAGDLQYERKVIAKAYLKSWFLIDILACLPINYVTLIAGAQVNCAGAQVDCTVDAAGGGAEQRANKFFRLLRLFRLLKLLRLLRMNRLMKKYEEQFYKLAHGLKLMKIAFAVVFCGHWIGCVWYFLGTEEWHDEQEFYPDGTEIRPWVTLQFGKQANESGRGTRYVTALYWSFQTMTTVGYGDIFSQTAIEKWVACLSMLSGGFVFGLVIGALSNLSKRTNPGQKEIDKRIGWLSAYLSDRNVSANLVRTIRGYFNARYDVMSAFVDHELAYFQQLPGSLRLELARQLRYVDHHSDDSRVGLLSRVPSLHQLDTLSLIWVCSRLKPALYMPSQVTKTGDREYIFRKHDIGHEMVLVSEGTVHLINDSRQARSETTFEAVTVLKFGDYVDEHMALLPPGGYLRRHAAYAFTEVTLALLSSEDLTQLRKERPIIDKHVRPFVTHAKRVRYLNNIDQVFAAMDLDGDGWITQDEFRSAVDNRKRREHGGNDAESFFHTVIGDLPVTTKFIEDTYSDIFLQDVKDRQEGNVYHTLENMHGSNQNVTVDKQQFIQWWVNDQTHEMDLDLGKKRIQADLTRITRTLRQMARRMRTLEHALRSP